MLVYKGQADSLCCCPDSAGGGEQHDDYGGGAAEEERGATTPSRPGAWTFGHARDETCMLVTRVLCCAVWGVVLESRKGRDLPAAHFHLLQATTHIPTHLVSNLHPTRTQGISKAHGRQAHFLACCPRQGGGPSSHFFPWSFCSASSSSSTEPKPLLLLGHHPSSSTLPPARAGWLRPWAKNCCALRLALRRWTCKKGDAHF